MDVSTQQHETLPYGIDDLDPQVVSEGEKPRRVRCYVNGCQQVLSTPTRAVKGDVCPDHGIRCHFSSAGATYAYADPARNIIASAREFKQQIIGHPFKYESHRLGLERSEDTLSWNVFRSLQKASALAQFANQITGETSMLEPFLYLWGIGVSINEFQPWDLLVAARQRFESNLPVERPLTEPDIALHLPGRYLILIEAKFTSPNTFYKQGPRKDRSSLTMEELLNIYQDEKLKCLNVRKAENSPRIPYQLWRNMIFAEWMAIADHPHTKAYHVNLVREGYEAKTAQEFSGLMSDKFQDRFQQCTWEQIYRTIESQPQLSRLQSYLSTKTAGLKKAFRI